VETIENIKWAECLSVIKDNISFQAYTTWFIPIIPIKIQNQTITLQVPSHFFYEWIEEHYNILLKKVIQKVIGKNHHLEYSIVMGENDSTNEVTSINLPSLNKVFLTNNPVSVPSKVFEDNVINPFMIPGIRQVKIDSNLNPSYSFDNFVEGDCNRLARSAGFAVANKPGGTAFNPLVICGGTGLGKTHLSHAIGIGVKDQFPNKTVLYVTAESFANQYIHSIKNKTESDFTQLYQMVDVLIMDDIQYLGGKEKTQDIFFQLFNYLHQHSKQLILTSEKPPNELSGIDQKLLSRFKWGLCADIQSPDLETRRSIIEKKVSVIGTSITSEIIDYLAYSVISNVREIEGALTSLIAQESLNKKAITLDLAKQLINKYVKSTSREVSIDFIQKVVCDYFNLPIETLKSKTRKREIVQARQISMYFSKKMTQSSLAKIGAHCGGRDHATVLHACRTVANLSETDNTYSGYIDDLEKKFDSR
jgi:chromosomal replication initiator protein